MTCVQYNERCFCGAAELTQERRSGKKKGPFFMEEKAAEMGKEEGGEEENSLFPSEGGQATDGRSEHNSVRGPENHV